MKKLLIMKFHAEVFLVFVMTTDVMTVVTKATMTITPTVIPATEPDGRPPKLTAIS